MYFKSTINLKNANARVDLKSSLRCHNSARGVIKIRFTSVPEPMRNLSFNRFKILAGKIKMYSYNNIGIIVIIIIINKSRMMIVIIIITTSEIDF